MAAKYGDRFRQVPTAPQRDVLDLGELDHRARVPTDDLGNADELGPEPAPGPRWHDSGAARLALVAALLIGMVGGAFGWTRWRTYEAAVAARSSVDLFASMSALDYPAPDEVSIGVRYRNDGAHDLVIRDVQLDNDHVVLVSEPDRLTIRPGATEAHILDLRARCVEASTPVGTPHLEVEVETIDGTVSHEMIDIDLGSEVAGRLSYICDAMSYQPVFGDSYAEVVDVVPAENGTVVRAEVFFGSGADGEVTITEVEADSLAFMVEYTVGHQSPSTGLPPLITVDFRVNDCAAARDATDLDMTISVSGSYAGTTPGRLHVPPSASLAAELVRMTERTCPA